MVEIQHPSLRIDHGVCYALFAYDVALAIDLDEAQRRVSAITQRVPLRRTHPAPTYFDYRPAPVRMTQVAESLTLGAYVTNPNVDIVLYDFGAVLVIYTIPLRGDFTSLLPLSDTLYDNALLLADSRHRVEQLCSTIQQAATRPEISEVVEDYVIFHIQAFSEACPVEMLYPAYGEQIARILRAEPQALSTFEVQDALSYRVSYGVDDMTFIDWNAALVYDKAGEDVRAVLEFANVELLEMRYLDQLLDDALDRLYRALPAPRWWSFTRVGGRRTELQRIARLQVDSAILFEGVNNALKLLGDQYLARVYRLASQRFHLAEWDASILRKLQTLESIYEKVSDQAASYRMEILEWIIILLIAFEIVWPFVAKNVGR
ncbi:MAG: hypothetical protein AB7P69_26345 [Candidatus Binatia bacterium]